MQSTGFTVQHGGITTHHSWPLHRAGYLASCEEPNILTVLRCTHHKESHSADENTEARGGEVTAHSVRELSVFALSLSWALQTHPSRGFSRESTVNPGEPGVTTRGLCTHLNT